MGDNDLTTLSKRLRPLMVNVAGGVITQIMTAGEGPGIDVVNNVIGLGLDSILLVHWSGDPASEYATISLACAAASGGDIVIIAKAGEFEESFTIPDYVTVLGVDRQNVIIVGTVTLGDASTIDNVSIFSNADDSNTLGCIQGPAFGIGYVRNCILLAEQEDDTGDAHLYLRGDGGIIEARNCVHLGAFVDDVEQSAVDVNSGYQTSWGFDADAEGWVFDDAVTGESMGEPTGTGAWVSGELRIATTGGGNSGAWYYTPAAGYIITSQSEVWGLFTTSNFRDIFIKFTDSATIYQIGSSSYTSYSLTAHAGKEIDWIAVNFVGYGKTFRLFSIGFSQLSGAGNSGLVYADGCDGDTSGMIPLPGDRGALDALAYPARHANDVDQAAGIHHTLGTGAGQAAGGDHAHDINSLSDVDTASTATGDVIYNSGSSWVDYPMGLGSKITVDGSYVKIGNIAGGHYVEVNLTSGVLRLAGNATTFRDILQSLVGQRLESPASDITQDNDDAALTFSDGCTLADYVTMNVQINHDWLIDSEIFPHLHWWQASANVPNWLVQYRWQIQGAAKTTAWTNLPYTTHATTYVSGTINQITDFGGIEAPEGCGLSDIVQFRLLRDTNNTSTEFAGADPLTGDVLAVNFDVHYEIDGFGSDTEYSK